jgi:hypothetical protein
MKRIPELFDLKISLVPLSSTVKVPPAFVPVLLGIPCQRDIEHLAIKFAFLGYFVVFIISVVIGFVPHAIHITRRKVIGLKKLFDLRRVRAKL